MSEQKYPSKHPSLNTPYLGYAKEVFMFWRESKGTAFSSGVQAVGSLVVESILLEALAFCNFSSTDRNSLSCVESLSSSIGAKPESFCNWGIGGLNRWSGFVAITTPTLLLLQKLRIYFFQVNLFQSSIFLFFPFNVILIPPRPIICFTCYISFIYFSFCQLI